MAEYYDQSQDCNEDLRKFLDDTTSQENLTYSVIGSQQQQAYESKESFRFLKLIDFPSASRKDSESADRHHTPGGTYKDQ